MKQHDQNSLWGLMAWATAALFYTYHQMIISAITVIPEVLMDKYGMSNTQYGIISVVYTIAYALMQIPVGIILDHYPLKRVMTGVLLTFTLGCATLAMTHSYTVVLIARFIMGMAAAFTVLGSFKLAAEWFSANYFATLTGLTVSLGYFGSMLGNTPFLSLLDHYAYEQIFWGFAFIGLGLSLMSFIFVDNYHKAEGSHLKFSDILSDLEVVVSNRLSLILIVYAMLVFTPLQVFKDSLGVMFFTSYYGYTKAMATQMMNIMLLAGIIAAPSLGIISDRMQKRRPIIVLSPALILVSLVMIILKLNVGSFNANLGISFLLTGLFGFMTWGFLLSYTVFKETHSPHIMSIGLGFMNSVNMLGGIVSVPIITALIDYLPVYYPTMTNSSLYFYAFLILPLIIAMTFPLLKYIPETNCRQVE